MKESVDILLATYNGELYVESQILSIISQSFKKWKLLIHDDGSNDSTITIIKKWAAIDHRIQLIEDNVITGGAAKNFMHLLEYSTSKYVMFCDQDDIWFDNKVQLMFDVMSHLSQDVPQVVYSNSYVWKPEKGILGKATLTFPRNLESLLFLNSGMQGCVAMFNARIRNLMLQWEGDLAMHDHLLHLLGLTMGNVTYVHLPLMLYRKHTANVTGPTRTKMLNADALMKNSKTPVVDKRHYNAVHQFVTLYDSLLNQDQKDILTTYLKLPHASLTKKLICIIRKKFKIHDSILLLIAKILLRPYVR